MWEQTFFNLILIIHGVCIIFREKLNSGKYVKLGSVVLLQSGQIKHRTDSIQSMALIMMRTTCELPTSGQAGSHRTPAGLMSCL